MSPSKTKPLSVKTGLLVIWHLQQNFVLSDCLTFALLLFLPDAGERCSPPSGAVHHRERPVNSHPQGQAGRAQGSLPATDRHTVRQHPINAMNQNLASFYLLRSNFHWFSSGVLWISSPLVRLTFLSDLPCFGFHCKKHC